MSRALSRKLRNVRERLGMSVAELSRRSHVAVAMIERVERGRVVSLWILRALCRVLGVEGGPTSDVRPRKKQAPRKRKRNR